MMIELTDYERDNLLALLHIALRSGAPLHTGDWTAQVYYKLAKRGFDLEVHRPNTPPDVQVADLRLWARSSTTPPVTSAVSSSSVLGTDPKQLVFWSELHDGYTKAGYGHEVICRGQFKECAGRDRTHQPEGKHDALDGSRAVEARRSPIRFPMRSPRWASCSPRSRNQRTRELHRGLVQSLAMLVHHMAKRLGLWIEPVDDRPEADRLPAGRRAEHRGDSSSISAATALSRGLADPRHGDDRPARARRADRLQARDRESGACSGDREAQKAAKIKYEGMGKLAA